ncbi:hypothetical protein [Amycolatopsis sp. NPDC051071]|uniref:hypothetical protein n=1 Tax=Amycolatopsis sp. NPDC051071 TaxID=3154637 RepID=UPI00343E6CD5
MVVLRFLGTLLWFGVSAGVLTYAVHDLNVRDAPTFSIEGTVVSHRQERHASSQDTGSYYTYFITVRGATGDFEFGDGQQAIDTEPGTPVVVQVSTATGEVVFLRKDTTVVDLRNTVTMDVVLIALAAVGLLIALVHELIVDDYHYPRWLGFVFGGLAAGGGGWLALVLTW